VAVLGRGRDGLGPLTFCPAPSFPPTTYYSPPPLGARRPGPQSVLARTATVRSMGDIVDKYDPSRIRVTPTRKILR